MELLTMDEAATSAGVSVRTLKREIAEGKLPVVCIRRRVQIDTRDLMAYLVRSKEVRTPICLPSNAVMSGTHALKSKAKNPSALRLCRFDPGSGHHKSTT